MSPDGLKLIGLEFLNTIRQLGWQADAVGGLTLGADPIAYAIAYASADTSSPIRAFTVRKEAKHHGTNRLIEGPFHSGDHVIIIEDVITTGGSALQAVQSVMESGGNVEGIIALIDRQEGGREAIEQAGYQVFSYTTAQELTTNQT